jgi:hypothetical protein
MTKLFRFVLIIALLVAGVAYSGVHKGPKVLPMKAFSGGEPSEPTDGRIYPSGILSAPGDSITYTTYDYGTNGSINRNLVNYGNGIISFARMMAQGTGNPPPDRGSWYNFSTNGGRTWQFPWARVENAIHGWTNIDQVRDFGGLEVLTSHLVIPADTEITVNVDADRGANSWISSVSGTSSALWPRLGIGSGTSFHIISGTGGNPATGLGYTRTTDAGLTFDRVDVNIFPSNAGVIADGYAASARGNKIAFVVVGNGNDVVLLTSTNNGNTWTTTTVYQVTTPPPQPQPQPDRSCDVLIDGSGVVHVVWSNFIRDGSTLFYSVDAPIMYWNSASQTIRNIAYPYPDTTMLVPTNSRFGNYANQPDLGADATGSVIYCTFSQLISERDAANRNYSHVYALKSTDGGTTWGSAVDITPGTGFDATFPSIPDLVEDTMYVSYLADPLAGGFIRGTYTTQTQVAVMLLRVPVSTLPGPTGVQELGGTPTTYALEQNYPNPFNPNTNIRFEIPSPGLVSLKVFNLLGQEVASLLNEVKQPGRYEANWDAQGVSSGVYFYKLTAGDYLSTKKMVLLK